MPFLYILEQLRVLYSTTLSQIICRNSDDIQQIRKYVMEHRVNEPNNVVDCDDIKNFNFTPWNLNQQPLQLFKAHISSHAARVHVIRNTTVNNTLHHIN